MSTKAFVNSAARLRLILAVVIFLLSALTIAIGFLGVQYLKQQAQEVKQVVYDAENSDRKLQRIQELAAELENNKDAAERAKQVIAESKSYQYQDVIIKDLQAMAKKAGVGITNFNFTAAGSGAKTPSSGTSSGTTTAPSAPLAGGLRSTTVDITLNNPVDYRSLLKFIHYIEQNLTKMQISKIGLAGANDEHNPGAVSSEALTIEVYIR